MIVPIEPRLNLWWLGRINPGSPHDTPKGDGVRLFETDDQEGFLDRAFMERNSAFGWSDVSVSDGKLSFYRRDIILDVATDSDALRTFHTLEELLDEAKVAAYFAEARVMNPDASETELWSLLSETPAVMTAN